MKLRYLIPPPGAYSTHNATESLSDITGVTKGFKLIFKYNKYDSWIIITDEQRCCMLQLIKVEIK